MAFTNKQLKVIEAYLWKYISDVSENVPGGKTVSDLIELLLASKTDQVSEIKAWAIIEWGRRKDKLLLQQTNLPDKIDEIDDYITDINAL
jgi:hypothetical protein